MIKAEALLARAPAQTPAQEPQGQREREKERDGRNFFIYTWKRLPAAPRYFRGMNLEEWVAPMPGRPCFTGLYVMENSPR